MADKRVQTKQGVSEDRQSLCNLCEVQEPLQYDNILCPITK